MNVPLIVAGSLAILSAAIHGTAGEILVVRKLSPGALASTPFGGPGLTKSMIRVAWHMATIGLLTVGSALLLSGSVLDGETAQALSTVAAGASTGFAALAVAVGLASERSPRFLFVHPGPALLTATGALAWWGAATV